jgi:hypothetical protein
VSNNINGVEGRSKDRGRNKEREMNAHTLHAEKELLQQRSKIARQVLKSVPKLTRIHKARDIFLSKHVSVQQLSRLLNVRLGMDIFFIDHSELIYYLQIVYRPHYGRRE